MSRSTKTSGGSTLAESLEAEYRIIAEQVARGARNLAVVSDIDDTALYYDEHGHARAVPEVHHFLSRIATNFRDRVAIFFLTARPCGPGGTNRLVTIRELRALGYTNWLEVFCYPEELYPADDPFRPFLGVSTAIGAFKSHIRAAIGRNGYVVCCNLGDQDSDHIGRHHLSSVVVDRRHRQPVRSSS